MTWNDYYRAVSGRPPRELYRQAVARFDSVTGGARLAIDLGCGSGIETLDLLSRGWQVVAIDKEAGAIDQLVSRVLPEHRDRLETSVVSFQDVELPAADFVWAGLSLPFCPPDTIQALWSKVVMALKPDGRFAGDFFGTRNAWPRQANMTLLTREEVMALCQPLYLEYFIEEEGERPTALRRNTAPSWIQCCDPESVRPLAPQPTAPEPSKDLWGWRGRCCQGGQRLGLPAHSPLLEHSRRWPRWTIFNRATTTGGLAH
jgi:tellurite methyltransferase